MAALFISPSGECRQHIFGNRVTRPAAFGPDAPPPPSRDFASAFVSRARLAPARQPGEIAPALLAGDDFARPADATDVLAQRLRVDQQL